MDLFNEENSINQNLLPQDGIVYYFGKIMAHQKASNYFDKLLASVEWKNDVANLFGKRIETKRKVAWYGEKPFEYTYSNSTKHALPWTNELMELKVLVEQKSGETFNSCLLNLYHNGTEGMAWHSDGEKDLKENGAIASLSLGAARRFSFKHKITKEKVSIALENGSLLIMTGSTQKNWLHRLPPTKMVSKPRINLTFRTIEK